MGHAERASHSKNTSLLKRSLFAREAKGHGVPEVMEAVALKGGRIRPIVAVVKSLASSFCIGSGGSVGREGPIVQIGAALGSSTGQLLRLSDERIRNLVACGAAGGIAATFNAPTPRGSTVLLPGDRITAFAPHSAAQNVASALRGKDSGSP